MKAFAAIRARIARLATTTLGVPTATAETASAPEPRLGEEASRALLEEILAYQRGLSEAIAQLPRKTTEGWPGVWRLEDDQLGEVFQVMNCDQLDRMMKLTRALEGGVLVVRQADGTLSPADAERIRAAEAEGRASFALNYLPPLEHQAIDVKAELTARANRGTVPPYNVEAA